MSGLGKNGIAISAPLLLLAACDGTVTGPHQMVAPSSSLVDGQQTSDALASAISLTQVSLVPAMLSQRGLGAFIPSGIADGDETSYGWHVDYSVAGSLPSDAPPGAYLQIDLGTRKAIVQIGVFATSASPETLYYIQYSDDRERWSPVPGGIAIRDAGWNLENWQGGDSFLVGAHRYWRLILQDSPTTGPWYSELAMWCDGLDYFKLPLSASMFSQSGISAYVPTGIVDGQLATFGWHTDTAEAGATLNVDLGVARRVYQVSAYRPPDANNFSTASYFVDESDDGNTWLAVGNLYTQYLGWNTAAWRNAAAHRYWRLRLMNTPGPGPWLSELQFFVIDAVQRPIALDTSMLATSGLSSHIDTGIVDGDVNSYGWHTDWATPGAWIAASLPVSKTVTGIGVYRVADSSGNFGGIYQAQASDNGQDWTDEGAPLQLVHAGWNTAALPGDDPHPFWRLRLLDSPGPSAWLSELQLVAID